MRQSFTTTLPIRTSPPNSRKVRGTGCAQSDVVAELVGSNDVLGDGANILVALQALLHPGTRDVGTNESASGQRSARASTMFLAMPASMFKSRGPEEQGQDHIWPSADLLACNTSALAKRRNVRRNHVEHLATAQLQPAACWGLCVLMET